MNKTTEFGGQQFNRYEIERDQIKSLDDVEAIEDYIYYKELDKSINETAVAGITLVTSDKLLTKGTRRFRLDKVIISDIKKFPI